MDNKIETLQKLRKEKEKFLFFSLALGYFGGQFFWEKRFVLATLFNFLSIVSHGLLIGFIVQVVQYLDAIEKLQNFELQQLDLWMLFSGLSGLAVCTIWWIFYSIVRTQHYNKKIQEIQNLLLKE